MNSLITSLVLGSALVLDVVLELKGHSVPPLVGVLVGFAVRHIIGGDTVKDSPTSPTAQIKEVKP
jgi:hypothetical protein